MKMLKGTLLSALAMVPLYAEATSIEDALKNGKLEGNARLAYINQHNHASNTANSYATALGGELKYETDKFNNISLAASVFVSQKISPLSGDSGKSELNGDFFAANGDSFAYIGEAYIDYAYNDLTLRLGRQKIDTPLSDTDDIRMVPNTFEALIAEYRGVEGFVFTAGHIQRWAGYDSGSDISKFKDMPSINGSDGASLIGLTNESIENITLQAWYYDFDKQAGVVYLDAVYANEYSEGLGVETGLQYINYDEQSSSAVDGEVYGGMLSLSYEGISVGAAYNDVDAPAGKAITIGYGGGPFFTSMEEMTIDAMNDADACRISLGADLSRSVTEGLSFSYAYGKFKGKDSSGSAIKVEENDFVLGYALREDINIEASYAYVDDKVNSGTADTGYDRVLVRVNYSF